MVRRRGVGNKRQTRNETRNKHVENITFLANVPRHTRVAGNPGPVAAGGIGKAPARAGDLIAATIVVARATERAIRAIVERLARSAARGQIRKVSIHIITLTAASTVGKAPNGRNIVPLNAIGSGAIDVAVRAVVAVGAGAGTGDGVAPHASSSQGAHGAHAGIDSKATTARHVPHTIPEAVAIGERKTIAVTAVGRHKTWARDRAARSRPILLAEASGTIRHAVDTGLRAGQSLLPVFAAIAVLTHPSRVAEARRVTLARSVLTARD